MTSGLTFEEMDIERRSGLRPEGDVDERQFSSTELKSINGKANMNKDKESLSHNQTMPDDLRRAYQELNIEIASSASQAFIEKYGKTQSVGLWLGYDYHGATNHSAENLTGEETYRRVVDELQKKLNLQNTDDAQSLQQYLDSLTNLMDDYSVDEDGKIKFQFYYTEFPTPRNTLSSVISNSTTKHEMADILDQMVLEKFKVLADPLIEHASNIYIALKIFKLFPDQSMYGQQSSEFIQFAKRIDGFRERYLSSPSLQSILDFGRRGRESAALQAEVQRLFSEAPIAVREAMMDKLNDLIFPHPDNERVRM